MLREYFTLKLRLNNIKMTDDIAKILSATYPTVSETIKAMRNLGNHFIHPEAIKVILHEGDSFEDMDGSVFFELHAAPNPNHI